MIAICFSCDSGTVTQSKSLNKLEYYVVKESSGSEFHHDYIKGPCEIMLKKSEEKTRTIPFKFELGQESIISVVVNAAKKDLSKGKRITFSRNKSNLLTLKVDGKEVDLLNSKEINDETHLEFTLKLVDERRMTHISILDGEKMIHHSHSKGSSKPSGFVGFILDKDAKLLATEETTTINMNMVTSMSMVMSMNTAMIVGTTMGMMTIIASVAIITKIPHKL